MTFIFDHRYADGGLGALFFTRFQKIFENAESFPQVFEARPSVSE